MNTKQVLFRFLAGFLAIIGVIILAFGGYIVYLACQYYRIADNTKVAVENNQTALVNLSQEYTITSYNIGFGAYSQDFSFFMDAGEYKNGKKVSGTGSRAKDKYTVLTNTNGAIDVIKAQNADFMFFQEVDTKAHRSYFVNQYKSIQDAFVGYSSSQTVNFHSGYLFYPFTNPHGAVEAGISTLSKYNIESVTRRSLPIDQSFPTKFFDLDRCFSVNKLAIEGSDKYLILINLHMSAYDKGGVYRAKQLKLLCDYMSAEYAAGNYVIAGGDWNHDIANSINYFETDMKVPDWVAQIDTASLPEHFSFQSAINCPTCRSTDIPYTLNENGKLVNYSVVIDGFMVSENVKVNAVQNIDTEFMFSDHNPTKMQFELKTM